MNYLSVENLTKSFGARIIFKDLTFGVDKGDKVAIVAKNGTGKSTLLKILCGDGTEDSGRIVYRNGIRVDYLEQAENFQGNKSIIDEVLSTETKETNAIKAYNKALENPTDTEAYEKAFEQMNMTNAWDYDVKVNTILSQLKIEEKNKPLGELSGGQKKRVALAKVLINEPDIMILDEPTNHLDLDMIEWLEEYLSQSQATIIMVTHDRYFLEVVCNTILELEDQTIYKYTGNFSYYLEKKAERQEILEATISKAKNLMRTELDWIRRQPKARGTKQKARVDAFGDLKKVATQKIQKDELEIKVQMNRLGSKIVELHRLGKSFDDKNLINDFSYVFKRGEKVGIVGPNGSGKSTFLNMLTGSQEPSKGKIVIGDTVVMGYYHQDGLKFKPEKRVIEVIRDIAEYIPLTKGRKMSAAQFLEKFLFPRDMHFNYVDKLSGGEKKRLYLMTILMKNPNFLILDEPTNDLDIFTLSVLEDYLAEFEGCLLIVSHDRYFLDKLVDHTFYFRGDGEIKDVLGNYTAYRQYLKEETSKARKAEKQVKEAAAEISKDKDAEKTKLTYKEKQEFEALEGEIAALETERDDLMEKMNSGSEDSDKVNQMAIRLGEIGKLIEEKEMRWLELSEYV
ncbi:ABC-F family ATP-binding cassette domain-containing protein [Paracrocinitomix mangrovi]|uniref:ABC-F family ATP-binding cassette domain-containing protein n=1 Tax=Paracrocinitomix mangrovi TaxID=2862509 RepID=UPI001C8E0B5C|nr:ABC-F family ATP-binding cassette domain-containing protein [Paracrocinitomix mangrovi]UKN01248.1 ABC-F family ATP-binding cassette domain-containing protein [Paracrocinitomix mangrovi]